MAAEVDPEESATFVVAALMGGVGFSKNALDVVPFAICRKVLERYAATLRPAAASSSS